MKNSPGPLVGVACFLETGQDRLAKYRTCLPQLPSSSLFLTDAGLETILIFKKGRDLPFFCSHHVLRDKEGEELIGHYCDSFAQLAKKSQLGLILESPTWRASSDWGRKLGYPEALDDLNRQGVALLHKTRTSHETTTTPIVISGCLGPRFDGYVLPSHPMDAKEAEEYHRHQIEVLRDCDVDMISAFTLTYASEAVGIVFAAKACNLPVVISFTLETDGKLPSCQTLGDAITQVDTETDCGPVYYMINCCHPSHFSDMLEKAHQVQKPDWLRRIRGMRVNSSKKSHAELNDSDTLDEGDPEELARQILEIKKMLPHLNIFGGCCGTDEKHIELMARMLLPHFPPEKN